MTISSATTRTGPYSGNGSTTVFAYTFVIYDQADLEVVVKTTSTGAESIRAIGTGSTNYAVSDVGTSSGGNVTMVTAPTSGETLTIRRTQTFLQGSDFTNQGAYVGETHERVYDETIQKIQQVDEEVDRSLKFPVSDAALTATLPASSIRAGTYLSFDSSGNVTTSAGAATDATTASTKADEAAASALLAASEVAVVAHKYTWSNSTSMADPGTGALRYNHGTASSVSAIAIDDTTADTGNPDINAFIATWDDSTSTVKGQLQIKKVGTPATFAIFNITGLTDNSGWAQIAVAHVSSSGTLSNSDEIRISFSRTGLKGDTGSQGVQGDTGSQGATGPVGVGLALALGG